MKLPPTKEEAIALKVCARISSLKNNSSGGDATAREAAKQIIAIVKQNHDEKLARGIEIELNKCHPALLA